MKCLRQGTKTQQPQRGVNSVRVGEESTGRGIPMVAGTGKKYGKKKSQHSVFLPLKSTKRLTPGVQGKRNGKIGHLPPTPPPLTPIYEIYIDVFPKLKLISYLL